MSNLRIFGAVACGLCVVGIDFTSMLMSVISDLFFMGALAFILYPMLKGNGQEEE